MQAGNLAAAEQAFRESLRINPGQPAPLANLGFCLLDQGRPYEALASFESALQSAPRHYEALFGLGLAYERTERWQAAVDTWRRYLSEAPPSFWKAKAEVRLKNAQAQLK